jgi:eukaryotic translation initiation factor 2C
MDALSNSKISVRVRAERRIFYTPFDADELHAAKLNAEVGAGIVVWRGYLHSLRPAIDRLLLNLDVCTGAMYRPGSLIQLAYEYLDADLPSRSPDALMQLLRGSENSRDRLTQFIMGLRVEWKRIGSQQDTVVRSVKGLGGSADREDFKRRDGRKTNVADYFLETEHRGLQYPSLQCVQVGQIRF